MPTADRNSTAVLEHARRADADAADEMAWRERLTALKPLLGGGGIVR